MKGNALNLVSKNILRLFKAFKNAYFCEGFAYITIIARNIVQSKSNLVFYSLVLFYIFHT